MCMFVVVSCFFIYFGSCQCVADFGHFGVTLTKKKMEKGSLFSFAVHWVEVSKETNDPTYRWYACVVSEFCRFFLSILGATPRYSWYHCYWQLKTSLIPFLSRPNTFHKKKTQFVDLSLVLFLNELNVALALTDIPTTEYMEPPKQFVVNIHKIQIGLQCACL